MTDRQEYLLRYKSATIGIRKGAYVVYIVWQESCTYIQRTTIPTDEEENDAFH